MCRKLVETIVKALILALFLRTWALQGVATPVLVVSNSMWPTLAGPHQQLACPKCAVRFTCEFLPSGSPATCPQCGERWLHEPAAANRPLLDRVLINRSCYAFASPRRWDVVAMTSPVDGRLSVKRVWGMPGEKVQIRDGDVFVDGRLLRKPDWLRRRLAIVVDRSASVQASAPRRWTPREPDSRWSQMGELFRLSPPTSSVDFLEFRYGSRNVDGDWIETPLRDEDVFNQLTTRRTHECDELALECDIVCEPSPDEAASLVFGLRHDGCWWEARVDLSRETVVLRSPTGSEVSQRTPGLAAAVSGRFVAFTLWCCDGQVGCDIGGRCLLRTDVSPQSVAPTTDRETCARLDPSVLATIGGRSASLSVRNLRVLRDIYVSSGSFANSDTDRPLDNEEYFLLGDNIAVSRDNRDWPPRSVTRNMLTGKVLMAVPVAFPAAKGEGRIHIPQFHGIRYIR